MTNILHLALFCAGVVTVVAYDRPGLLPRPYCGITRNGGPTCCHGRRDECGFPINFKGDLGIGRASICYCDDFCDRGVKDDCCPDYFEVCRGQTTTSPPATVLACVDGNKYYIAGKGEKLTRGCNECECVEDRSDPSSPRAYFKCEQDPCIITDEVLRGVPADPYSTWQPYNYTQFQGKKLKDGLIYKLGTLPLNNQVQASLSSRPAVDMPTEFDARDHWPGYISPVVDQEWCGSDWAITVATVASDRFAIQSNGAEKVVLSPQIQLSCNKEQRGCDGGHIDKAWNFARLYGLVDEECLPYKATKTRCTIPYRGNLITDGCRPVVPQRSSRYRVGPVYRIKNEQDIMNEIKNSGPVHAVMTVYQDFFHYRSGIYRRSRHGNNYMKGLHSVRIVGWGEELGDKYWIVANSWGCNWGEDGYFRIARGENQSGIESFVVATLSEVTEAYRRIL